MIEVVISEDERFPVYSIDTDVHEFPPDKSQLTEEDHAFILKATEDYGRAQCILGAAYDATCEASERDRLRLAQIARAPTCQTCGMPATHYTPTYERVTNQAGDGTVLQEGLKIPCCEEHAPLRAPKIKECVAND